MNHGPLIFLGMLFSVVASWFGLVLGPQLQFGAQEMVYLEETGESYPSARSGQAKQGAEVYRAQGCVYCHTQQVRPAGEGADLARKWGKRRTVSRDYLRDQPVMLGRLRLGPDLANLGARETNAHTLLLKLYNPQITLPGSTMPRHPFLFEKRKLKPGSAPSPEALALSGIYAPPAGCEVVPRPEAEALVAYLLSLKAEPMFYELFTEPAPKRATNRVASLTGATNAAPGAATLDAGTNSPAAK